MNRLYVVGFGPGALEKMTLEAKQIIEKCDVVIGYTVYVELIKKYYPDKQYETTGMTKEVDRCERALSLASDGKEIALVCSGDSGVYGMASIMLELSENYPEVEIIVVPGVTAALSGGALLGAPLGHDFVTISLSDRLTDMQLIEKRLHLAAEGDFAMSIYNPVSKGRPDYLKRACDIILEHQPASLVCGYAKNIGREGECFQVLTLGELRDAELDMFTTVFIGNRMTKNINGRMVTPRGYKTL